MPMESKAQNRYMHEVDENPSKYPASTVKAAHEFISAQHGHSVKTLPERVQHKAQGGAVYPAPFRW